MIATAQPQGMLDYFKLALSKYTIFTGRSRRSEYWYFSLAQILIGMAINALAWVTGAEVISSVISMIFSLAMLLPGLAVAVRRLHDVGKSGWWLLIAFTIIGIFLILYWYCQDSEPGANKYGPNPKTGATDNDMMRHLVD